MDKLEKIRKFVAEESKHVNSLISHAKKLEDCAVELGALCILEKLNRILEDDNGLDNK